MKQVGALVLFIMFLVVVWVPSNGSTTIPEAPARFLSGTWLYVGGVGPNNYTSIQEAVDHALEGDSVFVFSHSSPYVEHVVVNRSIYLIGENRSTTVIDGSGVGDVVLIQADDVTISGFTVQHGGDLPKVNAGIESRANRSVIHGNVVVQNGKYGVGVLLNCSSGAHVFDNIISENGNEGVFLGSSSNATIEHNEMTRNGHCAVVISKSSKNTVIENTMTDNYAGVSLWPGATDNEVARNLIHNQDYSGIGIWPGAGHNSLHDNTLSNNSLYGVLITKADDNMIAFNTIQGSNEGIRLFMANKTIFKCNNFISNNRSAFFENSSLNRWMQNYWDDHVSRMPKCIHGLMRIPWNKINVIRWINLDWRPAQLPYDVPAWGGTKDCVASVEQQHTTVLPMAIRGTTLYVGGTGPGNFTKIQDAIENATSGDTVFVYHGFYAENIYIGKSITVRGENHSTTVIDGGERGTVVTITASNVIIQGFTIQHSKNGIQYAGISVSAASNVLVTENTLRDNEGLGISIRGPGTSHTLIQANTILNSSYGLYLEDCSQANITGNTIMGNGEAAYLVSMSVSSVNNNFMSGNSGLGLHLEGAFNVTISRNTFGDDKNGMYLYDSSACRVIGNTVYRNRWYGIWLKDATDNTIEDNTITKNGDLGVYFDASFDNTIFSNTIVDNDNGIYFKDSSRNVITNNNLRNDKFNADFVTHTLLHFRNTWRSNYWERPRVMPYPISGSFKINNTPYPLIAFDWFPLRKPPEVPLRDTRHSDGNIWYVGGSGPNNYSSIQDAINHAKTNDTVFVFNGTYHEAFVVDKPLHIVGEDKTTTVLDGDGTKDLVTIIAEYVSVSGFTIQNSHFDIFVNHSSHGNISGNIILSGLHGVSAQNGCRFITISRNSFVDNVYGVRLYDSSEVTVSYNNFHNFKLNAFYFGTGLSQAKHHWYHNYWDKPRHLPYTIRGKIRLGTVSLLWLNFDWAPSQTPF
jgi:parallel beta-helix repeat protein